MKIFVPIFRQIIPAKHPEMFVKWMVEVSEHALRKQVIPHWHKIDTSMDIHEVGRLYKMGIEEVCGQKLTFGTLDPAIRRPIMTVHAGASAGNKECSEQLMNLAYTVGFLTAKYKWSFGYGGGETGGMGEAALGFFDGLKKFGKAADQYSIQVIPANFVEGVKSLNGLRPANEGLSVKPDYALVLPDFMTRRYILDDRCSAAITCPGSIGSLDEWSDIAVAYKTGQKSEEFKFYTLNAHVESLTEGFYDPLKKQVENSVKCGLQDPKVFDHLRFMDTPEAIFKELMTDLGKKKATPEQKYRARRKRFEFTPGIPRPVVA